MPRRLVVTAAAALVLAAAARPAAAVQLPKRFVDQLIIAGLNEPTGMALLPDQRMLIMERQGTVRLLVEGKLGAIDPLFQCDSVDADGDRGASGIAVDPRWPTKPYVYVYYESTDQNCKILRYTVTGDLAIPSSLYLAVDPASRYTVIHDIPDLQSLHNGGTVRFGPDSMLYAALGDDGFACTAQDTTSLRGVMIRIDVRALPDGPGGPPDRSLLAAAGNPLAWDPIPNARLVWANGLRNPFRFHFDWLTGSIFVADVGLDTYEEIDQLGTPGAPLKNFGWPYYEGPMAYGSNCAGIVTPSVFEPPIYAYNRIGFTASVISGGVYRRTACATCSFPAEYEGDYFLSDFYEGFLRRIKFDGTHWALAPVVPGQPNSTDWGRGFEEVADYAEGADGALWYVRMGYDASQGTGEIHRIFFDAPPLGVDEPRPADVRLATPYPTPSRGSVDLRFELERPAAVTLEVLDVEGRHLKTLVDASESAGVHHGLWDGADADGRRVPPGVYVARLIAGSASATRRVVIVR